MRIAAVVVLFNPDDRVSHNIRSYLSYVEKLFVVDNSESVHNKVEASLLNNTSVKYIQNGSNLGIAAALNIGASVAVADGFDYLLTMDQDSKFSDGEFGVLLDVLRRAKLEKMGILSPVHNQAELTEIGSESEFVEVPFTMTSGNILNLAAFRVVGEFDATLFIDHVDHEYCFRLAASGYKVLVSPLVQLNHELGQLKTGRLLWMAVRFVSHSPVRTYYMVRNGLIVARRYRTQFPWFFRLNVKLIIRELCKVPFESNKWTRLKLLGLAFVHYRRANTGKLKY